MSSESVTSGMYFPWACLVIVVYTLIPYLASEYEVSRLCSGYYSVKNMKINDSPPSCSSKLIIVVMHALILIEESSGLLDKTECSAHQNLSSMP